MPWYYRSSFMRFWHVLTLCVALAIAFIAGAGYERQKQAKKPTTNVRQECGAVPTGEPTSIKMSPQQLEKMT
jgi:hypothetical protein